MTEMKLDNHLDKVENLQNKVKCIWKDGHESIFSEQWLMDRRFTDENVKFRTTGMRDNPVLVGSHHTFQTEEFEVGSI